jgi:cysteinyl-tRNA synthetase
VPIVFYNSLTKKKEELLPAAPPLVTMYTCGVTVYDDCHVGHARSLYIFNTLKNYLEYRGLKVKLVRNITDVDDKIIRRAHDEGADFNAIRQRYIDNYYRDLAALEIDKADFEPLATENVFYMVDHIKQLIARGAAYAVDGDVYFSVRAFGAYGRLSGQSVDEMKEAVRIDKDEKKKDPLDFALWKKSKEGEPRWPSPWGEGRPGWHIECSTMSMRYLRTQTLDIHAGGRDLIFPHHENEIAQAEALTGQPFARTWIHHGLLTINGQKMSKSLGNFVTIQEALKRYEPNILKLFFLSAHYGSPMDFTYEGLDKTRKAAEKIQEFLERAWALGEEELSSFPASPDIEERLGRFREAMDDDFNTAQGLAVFFDLVSLGNKYLAAQNIPAALAARENILVLSKVLGLVFKPSGRKYHVTIDERVKIQDEVKLTITQEEIQRLTHERQEARQRKDFKRADEIRAFLKSQGIVVEDTKKAS